MPRRLNIACGRQLDVSSKIALQVQIRQQLIGGIFAGRFQPGQRPPARPVPTIRKGNMGTWRLLVFPIVCAAPLLTLGCGGGGSSAPAGPVHPTVTSEADSILHMDQVRATGFRGAGKRVGVISTGVVYLGTYQSAGLIPQSIYITQNFAGSLDEGSWMLEL